jgi:hypothetical protein
MPKRLAPEFSSADDSRHHAQQAWAQLGPDRLEPDRIEVLQCKTKSAIYRLSGVGPRGAPIIAKRCFLATARVERILYQDVLPELGIPFVRCHGFLPAADGQNAWLFLENAEGQNYSLQDRSHRAAAGTWLGKLHCSALSLDLSDCLPSRDFGHYLQLLRSLRALFRGWLSLALLPQQDISVVEFIASALDELEAHWPELEELCSDLPRTVVHGDFVRKNLRVQGGPIQSVLLVFDWEYSGWGVPAVDLVQFVDGTASPDLQSYQAVMARFGHFKPERIEGWSECGRFFRLLDNIDWSCAAVQPTDYRHLSKPVSYLRIYGDLLKQALQAAPWAGKRACWLHA